MVSTDADSDEGASASRWLPAALRTVGHRLERFAATIGRGTQTGEPDDAAERMAASEPTAHSDGESVTAGGQSQIDILVETGLTPPEYLLELLRQRGGRVRQQDLIATTGWSTSTVSRLLQEMETDEQVVRISIGREKLVNLPEFAPDAAV